MKKILLLILFLFLLSCMPNYQKAVPVQDINDSAKESLPEESIPKEEHIEVIKENLSLIKEPEVKVVPKEELPEDYDLLKTFLESAPSSYWFVEKNSGFGYVVKDNKRGLGEYKKFEEAVYWDQTSKETYIIGGDILESWWLNKNNQSSNISNKSMAEELKTIPAFIKFNLTGSKDTDDKLIPIVLFKKAYFIKNPKDKTEIINPIYLKSPVDWMIEYKDETPIKIEKASVLIKFADRSFTSDLAIYFNSKDNPKQKIIMRFDNKRIPIVIEVKEDDRTVRKFEFIFDSKWYNPDTDQFENISEKLVSLPDDAILITADDLNDYIESLEK